MRTTVKQKAFAGKTYLKEVHSDFPYLECMAIPEKEVSYQN